MDPGPERRPASDLGAGLEKRDCWIVIDRFGVHRPNDTKLVTDGRGVGEQFAEPRAGLTVLFEVEDGTGQRNRSLLRRHSGETLAAANALGQLLPVQLVE